MSIGDDVSKAELPAAPAFDLGEGAPFVSPDHPDTAPDGGSHRSDCNNAIGVPAGTDGSLMSIGTGVSYAELPAAPAFDLGDGAPLVSPDHPDTAEPPALTRSVPEPVSVAGG